MKDQDNNIDMKTEDANSTEDSLKASDVEEQAEEKTLEQKYDETYDSLLRAKAEVENIKKRTEKEISNAYKFSTEGIFLDLIPIFESLDIAITQASETTNIDNLIEGNKLLKSMFDTFFDKNSLEVINPVDQKFDPNLHQAIKTVKDDSKENNFVSEVLQKGYKLVNRVIKPALVVVIKN
jgi:molecular chaperone GrpE